MIIEKSDIYEIQELIKLMTKNSVEHIKLPCGLEITKKVHYGKSMPKSKQLINEPVNFVTDEDILFASTTAPKRTLEDFNRFTSTPIPKG